MSAEKSFEDLKTQDAEIRRIVNASNQETTPEAVARAMNALFSAHFVLGQTWTNAAKKLAVDYGFVWPDYSNDLKTPFEVPLGVAWDHDKEEIVDLKANIVELEADQENSKRRDNFT